MAKQEIDTMQVTSAKNRLSAANSRIDTELGTLKRRMQTLENSWRGSAGAAAQTAMYEIFSQSGELPNVLKNYAAMLEEQVTPGYVLAENENTFLAAKFK